MQVLRRYRYSHEANLDLAKLQDEGITAAIFDDNIVTMNVFLGMAAGGIRLMVNDEDIEKAEAILNRNDYGDLENAFPKEELEPQIVCPSCGSANVSHAVSKKFSFLILFFLWFPVPVKENSTYRCSDCSAVWKEDKNE